MRGSRSRVPFTLQLARSNPAPPAPQNHQLAPVGLLRPIVHGLRPARWGRICHLTAGEVLVSTPVVLPEGSGRRAPLPLRAGVPDFPRLATTRCCVKPGVMAATEPRCPRCRTWRLHYLRIALNCCQLTRRRAKRCTTSIGRACPTARRRAWRERGCRDCARPKPGRRG